MVYLFLIMVIWGVAISWLISNSKIKLITKAILIASLLYMNFCIFVSFESAKGWPTKRAAPEKFELKAYYIKESDKKTGTSGAIYIWIVPEEKDLCTFGLICLDFSDVGAPKAYKIPYSEELHFQLLKFGEAMALGETVIIEKKTKENDGVETEEEFYYQIPEYESYNKK